jgi:hypothetical protein
MIALRKRLFRALANIRPSRMFSPPCEASRVVRARLDFVERDFDDERRPHVHHVALARGFQGGQAPGLRRAPAKKRRYCSSRTQGEPGPKAWACFFSYFL